jgi:hypothetical protein
MKIERSDLQPLEHHKIDCCDQCNIDGYSHCNQCNKVGSFWDDNFTSLFAQDFDSKVYCSDCIPEWWEDKLDE